MSGNYTNKQFQTGTTSGETLTLSLGSIDPGQMSHGTLGTLSEVNVSTQVGAQNAIQVADAVLENVDRQKSQVGSNENQ